MVSVEHERADRLLLDTGVDWKPLTRVSSFKSNRINQEKGKRLSDK